MSKIQLYIIYDTVAMTTLGGILLAHREQQAIRTFSELLNNKDTAPGQYPSDFTLLHVGEMNTDTGELTGTEPKLTYTGRLHLSMKEHAAQRSDHLTADTASRQAPGPNMNNNNDLQPLRANRP